MKKRRGLKVFAICALSCCLFLTACGNKKTKTDDNKTQVTTTDVVDNKNINFMVDGKIYQSVEVENGKVILPTNPTKEGYTFKGWFLDEAFTKEFVNSNLKGGIKVYALFSEKTVIRYVDGEEKGEVSLLNVDEGIVAKENLVLDKWYIDEACTTKYTNQDIDKLYARNMAKVTFNDGYQDVLELLVKPNTKIENIDKDSVKQFYMDEESIKFVDSNNNEFDFDTNISINTNIKVSWYTPYLKYQVSNDQTYLYGDSFDSKYYLEYRQFPVISIPSTAKVTVGGIEKELPVYSAYVFAPEVCKKVIIEDGIKEIVKFSSAKNLEEVVLPNTLEIISESFNNMPKLSTITLPNGLKAIYDSFWKDQNMDYKGENVGNTITRKDVYDFNIAIPDSVISMSSVPSNLTFTNNSIFYKENGLIYTDVSDLKVLVSCPSVNSEKNLIIDEGTDGIQAGCFAQLDINYLDLPSTFKFVNKNLDVINYAYSHSPYLYDEAALSQAKFAHSYMYSIYDRLNDCKAVIIRQTKFDDTLNDYVITGRKAMNNYVAYNDTSFADVLDKVYFIGDADINGDEIVGDVYFDRYPPYGIYAKTTDTKYINGKEYYSKEDIVNYSIKNLNKGDDVEANKYYVRSEKYVLTADKYSVNRNKYYVYDETTGAYTRKRINVGTDLSTITDTLYEYKYSLTTDSTFRSGISYYTKNEMYSVYTNYQIGDSVESNKYYELVGDNYVLTEDTSFAEDKEYYIFSGYKYVNSSVKVGDNVPSDTYYVMDYEYTLTTDTVFSNSNNYYIILAEDKAVYSQVTVTAGDSVESNKYYELVSDNYVLTEDTTFAEGKTYYVKSVFNTGEYYVDETINRGDSCVNLYELVDDEYVLTTDTVARTGKDYYQRSVTTSYHLIEEYNGVDTVNVTIFYNNTSTNGKATYKIANVLAGNKITYDEIISACNINLSETSVSSLTEYLGEFDFNDPVTRNLYFTIDVEYNCTGFTYEENNNGEIVITGFDPSTAGSLESGYYLVVIPGEVDGKKVVEIKEEAFKDNDSIERIIIGANVKVIGKHAFMNASALKYVSIAAGSLEEVKEGAFLESAITEVQMPLAKLKSIEPYAFKARNLKGFYPVNGEENRCIVKFDLMSGEISRGEVGGFYFTSDFWNTSSTDGSHFGILKYVGVGTMDMPTAEGATTTVEVPIHDAQLVCIAANRTIQSSNTPNIGWTNRKNITGPTSPYPADVIRYEIMEGSYYYLQAPFLGPVSYIHKNAFTDMSNYISYVYKNIPSSYGLYDAYLDVEKVKTMDSSIFEAGWWCGLTEGEDYALLVEAMAQCRYTDSWCA